MSSCRATNAKAFSDAQRSKSPTLRVRDDNPALAVEGPDPGAHKAKAYLYPSELFALVTCPRVPVRWRRLFIVAVYTYMRAGEIEALRREDVDLAHGVVHVHRSIDRETGEPKETKTDMPRRFRIEPALAPILSAMMKEPAWKSGRLLAMPPLCDLAKRLRKYLEWAGVDRAELFAGDATRKQITFHDLRATGITWMAVRGDEPLKIMQRAGHRNFSTTEGYIRTAENLRGAAFGDVFPELPAWVWTDEGTEGPKTWGQLGGILRQALASPAGFESGVVPSETAPVGKFARVRRRAAQARTTARAAKSAAGRFLVQTRGPFRDGTACGRRRAATLPDPGPAVARCDASGGACAWA